ncbi:cyclic nucleotide-binding-like protein [Obelidium mucronatum]|nr:cyclic nucleotide-binding-like protein [Obelidium mucronatum]
MANNTVVLSLVDITSFLSEYQGKYEQLELQMKQFRATALKLTALLSAASTASGNHDHLPTFVEGDTAQPRLAVVSPSLFSLETSSDNLVLPFPKPASRGTTIRHSRRLSLLPTAQVIDDSGQIQSIESLVDSLPRPAVSRTPSKLRKLSSVFADQVDGNKSIESLRVVDSQPSLHSAKSVDFTSLFFKIRQPSLLQTTQVISNNDRARLSSARKFSLLPTTVIINRPSTTSHTTSTSSNAESIQIDMNMPNIKRRDPSLLRIVNESGEVVNNMASSHSVLAEPKYNELNVVLKEKSPLQEGILRQSLAKVRNSRLRQSQANEKNQPRDTLTAAVSHKPTAFSLLASITDVESISQASLFYIITQFLTSVLYFTELWYIPLAIGFDLTLPVGYSVIVTIVHLFDCFVEFFTIRKQMSLKEWQLHYLKHGFFIDLITSIPFERLIISNESTFFWSIKLLRLHKLPRILSTSPIYAHLLKRVQSALGVGQAVILILPLTLVFCYFLHFQACVLFLGGRLAEFTNDDISKYEHASLSSRYTWSLLAAVGNVFQVGYKPKNLYEQWIVVSFVIIGAGINQYASIVGAISSLAMGFDASGRLYRQKLDELQEYMHWKDLGQDTRQKVLKYYDLKYRGKYFEEGSLLNDMNESLRMEIAAHNCRDLISKVSFLRREEGDGRDELFLGKIATALVPCYFVTGDILFTQGQPGTEMYFILNGSVNVVVQGVAVATLNEGSFFGEIALMANIPRTATIQAAASCLLYRLTRAAFTSILEEFEDVKHRVDVIYQQRMEKIRIEFDSKKLIVAKELAGKVPILNRCQNDGRDQEFLQKIANLLEPVYSVSGGNVFHTDEERNDLYFIKNGSVDIMVESQCVSSLKSGDVFSGEVPTTAQASTSCQLFKLKRDAFMKISSEFPDFRESVDTMIKEREKCMKEYLGNLP